MRLPCWAIAGVRKTEEYKTNKVWAVKAFAGTKQEREEKNSNVQVFQLSRFSDSLSGIAFFFLLILVVVFGSFLS